MINKNKLNMTMSTSTSTTTSTSTSTFAFTHTPTHTHTLTFTFIAPHADSLGPHSPARSLSIRVAVPGSRGVPRVCSSRPSRASCGSRAHGAIARADSGPSLTTHLDLLAPLRRGSRYSCSYRHLHDPELLVLVRITSACALVQL